MTDLREAMRATAASKDLVAVDVPEWEQKVYIRKLTVRDQRAISDTSKDPVELSVSILIASIVDENGVQLLDANDLDLLMDQPWPVMMPLMAEAAKQNGLSGPELEEAMATFQGRSVEVPAAQDRPSASPDDRRDRGDAGE